MEIALPLQQHPRFASALAMMGRPVQRIAVEGAASVIAVKVAGQLIASRGPVWRDGVQTAALRASRLRAVNMNHPAPQHMRAAGFRQLMTTSYVAELDLQSPRIPAMKCKWRNAWRRSCRAPVTITSERFDANIHGWLCTADLAQQKAKRFRGLPHSLINAYATIAPDAVCVFVAKKQNTPLAAMLFLTHAPVVTYHLGWIGEEGRRLALHHRLLIAAADGFRDQGYSRLDLGTVETDAAPGLARFKIGSGARVRPLGGTWLRTPV